MNLVESNLIMLASFLASFILTARSTTLLDFGCNAGDTCSEMMQFLAEENAKQEHPVPDSMMKMLTPTCNTDDGYCSVDCSGGFSFVCPLVPEGQIVVDASVVYCDEDKSWCAVDLTCISDVDCTSKNTEYKCSSTGACMPSASNECTDNSDCTADGIGYCDTRTYSGVTLSFCDLEPCAKTDDCLTSGYVCGETGFCVRPSTLPCGFIVLETDDEPFARPLDVCTNSMMITCKDNVYTRRVYDDDSCNDTVISVERVGENCTENVDCVCGVGSACEYATWTRYLDTVDGTCDGTSHIEMAVVLNECTNGVVYECGNDTYLSYETCDEGASNTRRQKDVCDLECNEGLSQVTVTTTEIPETTEGTEESKPKSNNTVIIIASVVGASLCVVIVMCICCCYAHRQEKSRENTSGYGVVKANDTDNEDVEMGAETREQ